MSGDVPKTTTPISPNVVPKVDAMRTVSGANLWPMIGTPYIDATSATHAMPCEKSGYVHEERGETI